MWPIETTDLGRIVIPPALPAGLALFYTTVDFRGSLSPAIATQLTAIVEERFGITATLATCTQIHSPNVTRAAKASSWHESPACDALWTSERGVALAIKVADCLPITIADVEASLLANIHSGWRGAVHGVTSRTVDALRSSGAFDPSRASAWLGPSIRGCCFEVGEEVVEQFRDVYDSAEDFVDRSRAKAHIDLPGLTANLLQELGFKPSRIHDSGLCTRCPGSIFHSFRRDGSGGGRNLAIAAQ